MRIDIYGEIIPSNMKWVYDYLELESTSPGDVQAKLDLAGQGETVDVYINSPGGEISSGSAIYTALRSHNKGDIKIHIVGMAHSAASVIAMAGWCEMSPTALMMVHCVSTYAAGNHNDLEKTAEVLKTADAALSSAYSAKSGMSQDEALAMMEKETWLRADEALKLGLIDKVMFEDAQMGAMAASGGIMLNAEKIAAKIGKIETITIDAGTITTGTIDAIMISTGDITINKDMNRFKRAKAELELLTQMGGK